MAVNIIQILPTTSIPSLESILNTNFNNLKSVADSFIGIYDSTSGTINISSTPTGIIQAKRLIIPTGNEGATIGNVVISDTSVSTSILEKDADIEKSTSVKIQTFSSNLLASTVGAVQVENTISTLVLDPTSSGLQFELAPTASSVIKEVDIVNLSTESQGCTLNITSDFVDSSNINNITIPYLKNIRLKYINDSNTSTTGWIIVGNYGCTIS